MAWTKITAPTGMVPLTDADYTAQLAYLTRLVAQIGKNPCLLTEWATLTQPKISDGVYWDHGGAVYLNSGDLTITGAPANGRVYVRVIDTAGVLVASFVNSAVGFSWNYSKQGFYHADGSQLLPYVLFKYGGNWYKHYIINSDNPFNITASIITYERVNIGAWNMNVSAGGTASVSISFPEQLRVSITGISGDGDYFNINHRILSILTTIYADDLLSSDSLDKFIDAADGRAGGYINFEQPGLPVTHLVLGVRTGSHFDAATHNDPGVNRGYVDFIFRI